MATALVNGEHVALENASVSILDRGLLFADSVYEVIPVYAGRPFRLAAHLARLQASLEGVSIPDPYTPRRWRNQIDALIEANGGGDLALYIQVTRGAPPRRDHRMPEHASPNVLAFCQSRSAPGAATLRDGVAAITAEDTRWRYCAIKSTSLLANILAARHARDQDAVEAILIRDGAVMEGTSSNVFAVIDQRIVTPALNDSILAGITRAVILELAEREGIGTSVLDVLSPAALRTASEVWITSSTREIHPVTELDGEPVGDGQPGAVWARMYALLQAEIDE